MADPGFSAGGREPRTGAWTPEAVTFRKFCMSKQKNLDPWGGGGGGVRQARVCAYDCVCALVHQQMENVCIETQNCACTNPFGSLLSNTCGCANVAHFT